MKYICNYVENNEFKKFYFNVEGDEPAKKVNEIMQTISKTGKFLNVENYSEVFKDYGYDSVEHFLYDFAKYYKISFESVLDKRETIMKFNTDVDTMLKISENISDNMVVSLEEFIKITHSAFESNLEVTIRENKHKMKAVVIGDLENNNLKHRIYMSDLSTLYVWDGKLDIPVEDLKQIIEDNCYKC